MYLIGDGRMRLEVEFPIDIRDKTEDQLAHYFNKERVFEVLLYRIVVFEVD